MTSRRLTPGIALLAATALAAGCGSQSTTPKGGVGDGGGAAEGEGPSIAVEVDVEATPTTAPAPATDAAFRGTIWVANGMDNSLSVVDASAGTVMATVSVGMNPHILAISPDDAVVYVVNAGQHDLKPGAHHGDATAPAEGDAESAAGMGAEMGADMGPEAANSVWAIDAATGDVLARVPVGQGPTHPLPSPDGKWLYVTNTDEGSVTVIDTSTWDVADTIADLAEPHDGEFTPDGKWLYLAAAGNSSLTVVDTATRQVVKEIPVGTKPRGVVVGGANGEVAYLTNKGDGTLSIIDVPSGQVKTTATLGDGPHALRLTPEGDRLYVAMSGEDAVAVVDAGDGSVSARIPVGGKPEQLDLSRDGRWLLVSNNDDSTLTVIDVAAGAVSATIPVGQGAYGVQSSTTAFTAPQGTSSSQRTPPEQNANGYVDLTVDQLAAMMPAKDFQLVNVHVPDQGQIPGTDLAIPFNEIGARANELAGKDAPIVVYCRGGGMSTQAAETLVRLGYTQVMELDGGFNAWGASGRVLETGPQP